jgi:hypothetical protein
MIYAAVIGIGGGFGAVGFRKLIDFSSYLFYGRTPNELANYFHGERIPADSMCFNSFFLSISSRNKENSFWSNYYLLNFRSLNYRTNP